MLSVRSTFVLASFGAAVAQTSLYDPGFDSQPTSTDILGIDGQGSTSWAYQGGSTGSFDGDSFLSTESASVIFLTMVDPGASHTILEACSFSSDLMFCSVTYSGEPLTAAETFTPINVQAGTTILSTSTSAPSFTSIPSSPAPGSSPAASVQTSERTSAPSPTQSSSGIVILPSSMSILAFSAVALALVSHL
ncbi:hypothetical protein H0H92_002609 [Tricholoma furcatifolium]|nr:hypothetical protein H0H92_002609 [Tricholoma furcatifolium]